MRIELATRLGQYILSESPEWLEAKQRASLINPWFTPEFIDMSTGNIAKHFLDKQKLEKWTSSYNIDPVAPKKIGIVMAGNIPLVGFHYFLCFRPNLPGDRAPPRHRPQGQPDRGARRGPGWSSRAATRTCSAAAASMPGWPSSSSPAARRWRLRARAATHHPYFEPSTPPPRPGTPPTRPRTPAPAVSMIAGSRSGSARRAAARP